MSFSELQYVKRRTSKALAEAKKRNSKPRHSTPPKWPQTPPRNSTWKLQRKEKGPKPDREKPRIAPHAEGLLNPAPSSCLPKGISQLADHNLRGLEVLPDTLLTSFPLGSTEAEQTHTSQHTPEQIHGDLAWEGFYTQQ